MTSALIRIKLLKAGVIFQFSIIIFVLSVIIPMIIFKDARYESLNILTIISNIVATIYAIIMNYYLFKASRILRKSYFKILLIFIYTWPVYFILMLWIDNKSRRLIFSNW
jgi:hypothetical protein